MMVGYYHLYLKMAYKFIYTHLNIDIYVLLFSFSIFIGGQHFESQILSKSYEST